MLKLIATRAPALDAAGTSALPTAPTDTFFGASYASALEIIEAVRKNDTSTQESHFDSRGIVALRSQTMKTQLIWLMISFSQ